MELTNIVRRDRAISIFIMLGTFLSIGVIFAFSNGYFQQWEKLPAPPVQPTNIITVYFGDVYARSIDSRVYVFDHTGKIWKEAVIPSNSFVVNTRTCGSDQPELSVISNVPSRIVECMTFTLAIEGSVRESYLIDDQGSVWAWRYSKGLFEYMLIPIFIVMSLAFWAVAGVIWSRRKNGNQLKAVR